MDFIYCPIVPCEGFQGFKTPRAFEWSWPTVIITFYWLQQRLWGFDVPRSTDYTPPPPPKKIWVSLHLARKYLVVNLGHYFHISYWRRDRHFRWSSEPHEELAVWSGKSSTFISQLFEDPEYWSGPGWIEPATSLLQSSALPTELILPQLKFKVSRVL